MTLRKNHTYQPATLMVHGGINRSSFNEAAEALFLTQGFVYDNAELAEMRFDGRDPGFVYSRYANPTIDIFEKRMCALEGAEEGRAVASGMAAVANAILCFVKAGDHFVASQAMFGSCRYIIETVLPRFGIESTIIDGSKIENWHKAVRNNTKGIFFETPANPTLNIVDIGAVCDLAHQVGATVIVDNVFATPLYQKPLALGADVVIYSTTKHIDGQGRCLGGIVLSSHDWIINQFQDYFRHTGPAMSPFTAWIMLKGLETLPLRVERMTTSAAKIAELLANHRAVARCMYPGRDDHPQADIIAKQMTGGSSMIAFELKGGKQAAFRFCDSLAIPIISNNLGDAKTIITHPATTTHQSVTAQARAQLGISDGLLRFSIGLEDCGDLLADIEAALDRVN